MGFKITLFQTGKILSLIMLKRSHYYKNIREMRLHEQQVKSITKTATYSASNPINSTGTFPQRWSTASKNPCAAAPKEMNGGHPIQGDFLFFAVDLVIFSMGVQKLYRDNDGHALGL